MYNIIIYHCTITFSALLKMQAALSFSMGTLKNTLSSIFIYIKFFDFFQKPRGRRSFLSSILVTKYDYHVVSAHIIINNNIKLLYYYHYYHYNL
jgi:hypothetical protein